MYMSCTSYNLYKIRTCTRRIHFNNIFSQDLMIYADELLFVTFVKELVVLHQLHDLLSIPDTQ